MSLEIITRLLFVIILVYIMVRFVVPQIVTMLREHFSHHEKNTISDLDQMIAQQEELLRAGYYGQLLNNASQSQKEETPEIKKEGLLIQLYHKENHPDYEELKNIMGDLQWGDHIFFKEIAQKSKTKLNYQIESAKVIKEFKVTISEPQFYKIFKTKLPTLKQLKDIILLRVILKSLLQEIRGQKSLCLITELSLRIGVKEELLKNLITGVYLFPELMPLDNILREQFINKKSPLDKVTNNQIYENIHLKIYLGLNTFKSFINLIKEYIPMYKILTPLPEVVDIKTALDIFAIENNDEVTIKKQYKNLARDYHPDKLKIFKLSQDFQEMANYNFVIIQNAYDVLRGQHK